MRLPHVGRWSAAVTLGCLAAGAWAQPAPPGDGPAARDEKPATPPKSAPDDGRLRELVKNLDDIRLRLGAEKAVKKLEKGAYLGVSTSPPPPALLHQLQLPAGVGLVVDFVSPKSPAAAAGLKQYDVLHKLDDQLLVNQQQLAVLVRTHAGGDEVKLTVLRDGKPQTLTTKLVEQDVPPLDGVRNFEDIYKDAAGQFEKLDWMQKDLENLIQGRKAPGGKGPVPPGGERLLADALEFTWIDGKTSMRVTTKDGHRRLVAKDQASGKVLFDGPVDTDEQRKAVPPALRDKLDKVGALAPPRPPAAPNPPTPPAAPDTPREPRPDAPPKLSNPEKDGGARDPD